MSHSNLLEMTAFTVARYGHQTALWNPAGKGAYKTWTYDELWQDVRRIAGHMDELGIKPGDRVGLVSESRAWWLLTDLAIMSLGAVTVPVFPNLGSTQVLEILNHAGVKGIVVQDVTQLEKILEVNDGWDETPLFVTMFDTHKGIPGTTDLQRVSWSVHLLDDWLASPPSLSQAEWEHHWKHLQREDLATIVYTSGTTGKPKGVLLTHGNLLANVEGIGPVVPIFHTDRAISYLPLSHIFERTASQFVLLNAGAGFVYSEGIDKIVGEFSAMPPTVFTTVPRLLEKVHEGVLHQVQSSSTFARWLFHRAVKAGIAKRVEKRAAPLLPLYDALVFRKIRKLLGGQLRLIVVGGAPLAAYVFEFFTAVGLCVVEGYGLTETSPVIAANPVTDSRKGTVGTVLHNVEVQIAQDGEVLVRGDSISQGYYKNDAATQDAYLPDGWFRTGDIGELTKDRYLKITDRKKNLLVLSTGKNVAPAPVESAILASSLIEQVLVIGNGRKFVAAIVVPDALAVKRVYQRQHSDSTAVPSHQELHDMLLTAVKHHTRDFAEYEQPKEIIVAEEPFTVENELMTPTLKVRANRVVEAYGGKIDELYFGAKKSTSERREQESTDREGTA